MKHLFLFLCLLFGALPALAQNPYKVEQVKINLRGVNPVEAREQALKAGEVKALKALLRGLNNGQAIEFDESRAASLVKDFELTDEQIAPSRYAATYTFTFEREATNELLRAAQYAAGTPIKEPDGYTGPQYSDLYNGPNTGDTLLSASTIEPYQPTIRNMPLLLPYWKVGEQVILWENQNAWRDTWRRLERKTDAQSEFMLPIGDLADMRVTTRALPENVTDIQQLLARYQTNEIIVAVGQQAISSITTTLYKATNEGLIFWKVIDSPMGPAEDPYSVAAGQIMAEIRGNSNPAVTSRPPQQARSNEIVIPPDAPQAQTPFFTGTAQAAQSTIRAESQFTSPQEWLRLKSNMTPENGIQNVRVIALTPRSAMVELQLSRPFADVQRTLGARRVALQETGNGTGGYVVRFMGS